MLPFMLKMCIVYKKKCFLKINGSKEKILNIKQHTKLQLNHTVAKYLKVHIDKISTKYRHIPKCIFPLFTHIFNE